MKVRWGREQRPNISLNKDFDFDTWGKKSSLSERRCYTWAWLKQRNTNVEKERTGTFTHNNEYSRTSWTDAGWMQ